MTSSRKSIRTATVGNFFCCLNSLLPPSHSPALRSFVAATFSGCLPFKWRSEEKLFICLAIDFVAIGVSGDALLNVPPPFHSSFLYLVLCHVMWQLWNRKQAVGVSGHRKIEASNEVNVRFVACLAVIAFRGANALICPQQQPIVSHSQLRMDFRSLSGTCTAVSQNTHKMLLLISLSTAAPMLMLFTCSEVTFQFFISHFPIPFRLDSRVKCFGILGIILSGGESETEVLNLWRKIWKLSQNTNADNEGTFLMAHLELGRGCLICHTE